MWQYAHNMLPMMMMIRMQNTTLYVNGHQSTYIIFSCILLMCFIDTDSQHAVHTCTKRIMLLIFRAIVFIFKTNSVSFFKCGLWRDIHHNYPYEIRNIKISFIPVNVSSQKSIKWLERRETFFIWWKEKVLRTHCIHKDDNSLCFI